MERFGFARDLGEEDRIAVPGSVMSYCSPVPPAL
jgi:hypothetical protein